MSDRRWPTYPSRGVVLDTVVSPDEAGRMRLRDTEGREYLDAIAGIGCAVLGHAHPLWVEAIERQLRTLASAANSFTSVPQQRLAERLVKLMPVPDAKVFFANTGTESTEAGIKLALRATGRDTIVACERAFHGRTLGAISLTANPAYRQPYVACLDDDPAGRFCQARVARVPFGDLDAAREVFDREGSRIAAFFLEPIQGEAGIYPASRDYLLGLRELCDSHGALLGVDEIQSGTGRTGDWSAWETIVGDAASPDLIWLAKALGNGFPVGACLARAELAEHMGRGSHGTTFGGNPVASAAALATLRIIEEEGLLDKARAQLPTLQGLAAEDPIDEVQEIRGLGSMIGIGIGEPDAKRAAKLGAALMEQGVLATTPGGHTVRLLLPYAAGRAQFEEIWAALKKALAATA